MSNHDSINKQIENYYNQKQEKIRRTAERQRIDQHTKYLTTNDESLNWRKWGCYLSERQWGTVREDYGAVGEAWGNNNQPDTFSRDQALNRAYRWGEDGIAGISDDHQFLCFAVALWNGKDPCIKERLYGLAGGGEGNHGEDVKEYYFYLDNTPTHSYMKYLYKYPYEYPYEDLFKTNDLRKRQKHPFEYELADTQAFANDQYFDVLIEYAKKDVADIYIRIQVKNCGHEPKTLFLLPTLWFRNTWSFREDHFDKRLTVSGNGAIDIWQDIKGHDPGKPQMRLYTQDELQEILFTDNNTDRLAAFHVPNQAEGYYKNGINNFIIGKYKDRKSVQELNRLVNPQRTGTKAALVYELNLQPGESRTVQLRISDQSGLDKPFQEFESVFAGRIREADEFYDAISPYDRNGNNREKELYQIQRQAFAGMLWNKQFFHFIVKEWLEGDSNPPNPPDIHINREKNNHMSEWQHLYCKDILLMPDKWEYPWFAAWDLAFQTVTVGLIDPQFAKYQLLLLVMEWYMHPNGRIPAFEWDFSSNNPPVHAWAALKVYEQEILVYGRDDPEFLERVFEKLNLNFTWWVNREDSGGNNIFGGGFLGLDNIRILNTGHEQADGTAWMAMFCLNMMKMANILKKHDLERKYLQHFIFICDAMNNIGGAEPLDSCYVGNDNWELKTQDGLWDADAGFFFDRIKDGARTRVKLYSLVGLIPVFAIEEIHRHMNQDYDSESFYTVNGTLKWFARKQCDLFQAQGEGQIDLAHIVKELEPFEGSLEGFISVVDKDKLSRILAKVLDGNKLLSDFGVRSLAKDTVNYFIEGETISYEPAETNVDMDKRVMGGNSNWRGSIWFPLNYLLIDSLRKFHRFLGAGFSVSYDNQTKTLDQVCDDLSQRLIRIFMKNGQGQRPVFGKVELFTRSGWEDLILFYEYFHGDEGIGLGAGHQTGWTGLVANLIQDAGVREHVETGILVGAGV